MILALDVAVRALVAPGDGERRDVERLVAVCAEHDRADPGIRFDTALNLKGDMPAWFLAEAREPSGHRRVLGVARIFAPGGDEGELSACVDPLFRRQGIFRALSSEALAVMRSAGLKEALYVADGKAGFGPLVAGHVGATLSHVELLMERKPEKILCPYCGT
ncbi:MAG TPA: hypothetical protein PK625_10315, partial [Spirochaetales bacterium]|nr:hypothetical protein [Spirochaetales bacterium]